MSTQGDYIKIWQNCLRFIADNITPDSYNTWFGPTKAVALKEGTLYLEVPSPAYPEFLDEHFADLLRSALRREIGPTARLEYMAIVDNSAPTPEQRSAIVLPSQSASPSTQTPTEREIKNPFIIPGIRTPRVDPQLNPEYSFGNFVEGPCNRLLRAAGEALAKERGKCTYSPLFIFGGSGLGKTHLAQAIGLEAKRSFPDKTVLYVNAARFQTQFVDARLNNDFNDFLHFYQNIDVLILDDVQEFSGKEKTQEAYFHIFNHLQQEGRQLVLTSDQAPSNLSGIQERLLSRFKWGLQGELHAPDLATRISILRHKARKDGIQVPEEVLVHLAENITNNIRELEGALVSLIAQSTLGNRAINMELALEMVETMVKAPGKEITLELISTTVCDYFRLPEGALLENSRKHEIAQARQIAFYIARELTEHSLSNIGRVIGARDHSTVNHSCNVVRDRMHTDRGYKKDVASIMKLLQTD